MTIKTITIKAGSKQIQALSREAAEAGDTRMVGLCADALDSADEIQAYAHDGCTESDDDVRANVRRMLDSAPAVAAEIGCSEKEVWAWCRCYQAIAEAAAQA